ncbi:MULTISPECIES: hypothetical protein [unclassified Streptomyces]|uniref:hypothetical protein n=1 Tax=unclassified Streptomyces TaxID=2593676 RepID=UPI0038245358
MIEPVTDQRLWGVVVLVLTFLVLVAGVLYAMERPGAETVSAVPSDAEAVYTYTCHCHREPIMITLRVAELPRRHGRGRLVSVRR